ncbi:MAG: hypothetical protein Q9163_001852, partial [Psora crenata]
MHLSSFLSLAAASVATVSAQVSQGFNYGSTYSDGVTPITLAEYEAQFNAAKNLVGTSGFSSARIYTLIQAGTTNTPSEAIQAAINTQTTLLLGIWASAGQVNINNELAALSAAISAHGTTFTDLIVAISLGSEDLYRISPIGIENKSGIGAGPDEVAAYIGQVKAAIANTPAAAKPVGHVDTWTAWVNSSNVAVITASDFIGMDAYPYFQSTMANAITDAYSLFFSAYDQTVAAANGKPVWVTETGWPVSGPTQNLAVASTQNAQVYWDQVGCGRLFGKINTWWFTLQDVVPITPSPSFGVVGAGSSRTEVPTTPLFDLSCSAASLDVPPRADVVPSSANQALSAQAGGNNGAQRENQAERSAAASGDNSSGAPAPANVQPTTLITRTSAPPAASAAASGCPASLSGQYEFPHLIVPVSRESPDSAQGTSYNGIISSTSSTLFNFDIPASVSSKTCTLVFLFPTQDTLASSSFALSGSGGFRIAQLESPATAQTTFNTVPETEQELGGPASVVLGNNYVIASGPCAAGSTVGYEISATGTLDLNYFQNSTPAPIGLFITTTCGQSSMQKFLKEWRQDAMHKHQYESAIYIGDKLLAITNDPYDAFFLAQVHFSASNYNRALVFLEQHNLVDHSPACRYLAAHCQVKQGKYEDALTILGDKNPSHLIISPSKTRRKLQHTSGNSRLGVKGGVYANGKPDRIERSEERDRENVTDIKYEAAMCYLRGICYAKQNAFDRAKECYKDAVRIDVQCFEAFEQLMKNKLMSPDEEWKFLESLDFESVTTSPSRLESPDSDQQQAAHFTKMLYTTHLSKYKNATAFTEATETLSTHYNLGSNPDLLLSQAELLFTQCRFKQSLAITTSILENDPYNFSILPLHLASLYELSRTSTLFLLSHRLADSHPEEPATWLAVGVYYLSISQIGEARRFFSKASMMDPHFGPAWVGFAHTFAAEGEHDQAISAYSTAARLFQGTHLPQLFLGMQNLCLGNVSLAHEYLNAAYVLCRTDPLLLNEMGVVFYHLDHLCEAIALFTQALENAEEIDSDPQALIGTRANLGHAYRRGQRFSLALREFEEVIRQGGGDGAVFSAKGLVLLELGRTWEAVCAFHEALVLQPQDPMATDLLGRALEEDGAAQGWAKEDGKVEDEEFENFIGRTKKDVHVPKAKGK